MLRGQKRFMRRMLRCRGAEGVNERNMGRKGRLTVALFREQFKLFVNILSAKG